jgi:RecA/RadA recombinase
MDPIKKLEDLMYQDFPEQTYIVERLIPDSSITIFSGYSRSFKTYTLLQIAISIASGEPLFGQFPCQQTGVLVIDEENGQRLLQKRLFQLGATADLPVYFTPNMGFELSDKTIDNVINSCKTHGIKLVIIDSLIRIHGSDENSAREMSKVFRQLRRFTEQDIAVLVTQHNRKQGNVNAGTSNEMRGSSDILAAVDSHVGVVRKNKWYLTFDQTKQRYDVELDPFEVKVTADENNFTFEFLGMKQSHVDKSEILRTAVTELLAEHGQLRQKDLLEKLAELDIKTNEHTLRDLLNRWVAEELLSPPLAGTGNTKFYRLNNGVSDE